MASLRGESLEDLKTEWTHRQLEIAKQVIFQDCDLSFRAVDAGEAEESPFDTDDMLEPRCRSSAATIEGLTCVGGMDISFSQKHADLAIASLVVLSFPDLKVLHTLSEKIELTAPYIPSFLSMREAPFLVALINRLRSDSFQPFPQVFFIDGNGRFHDRSAGLATVVGVLAGVPTVGTAKEYQPLREALQYGEEAKWRASQKAFKARCKIVLRRRADWLGLHKSDIPDYAGAAVLTSPRSDSTKPLFVSPGHRVSLRTAVALTLACCTEARVPEAVRQADALSRHVVKETWDG